MTSDGPAPARLDQLTSAELDAITSGEPRRYGVVLPVGSTEQHGPVLPLGCDMAIARGAAERLAAALAGHPVYRAFVLPDFAYTPCPGAERTAGTISVEFDWMGRGLVEVLRGALRTPWRFVVIVNAHGHNHGRVIETSMAGARGDLGRQVPVIVLQIHELARLAPEFGLVAGTHAGEFEIALLKHYVGYEPASGVDGAEPERQRPAAVYGLDVMPRSRAGVISEEPPRLERALERATALGSAVDRELERRVVESLDAYFEEWLAGR